MKEMKIRITFTEDVLGMMPSSPHIYEEYVASKAPDAWTTAEEVDALGIEAVVENGRDVFPKLEDGTPYWYDYHFKGFLKDSTQALRKVEGTVSSKYKAYKKTIDGNIFFFPRRCPIHEVGPRYDFQRPLRAATPMGERISLKSSETIKAGAWVETTVMCQSDKDMELVKECLDYGRLRGMGEWRNAGWGRFTWEEVPADA